MIIPSFYSKKMYLFAYLQIYYHNFLTEDQLTKPIS